MLEETQRRLTLEVQCLKVNEPKSKNTAKLKLVVCLLCLSTFYFGYSLTQLAFISKTTMLIVFGSLIQDSVMVGLLIGLLSMGAATTSLVANSIMKCFSRRKLILLISVCALASQGLIQYPNVYCLIIARICQGMFIGIFMAATPVYIYEISPKQFYGSFSILIQLSIVAGVICSFIIGTTLTKLEVDASIMWRIIFGTNIVTMSTIILSIIFDIIPESPDSLVQDGKIEQAKNVVAMFHTQKQVQIIMHEKLFSIKTQDLPIIKGVSEQVKYSWKVYLLALELPFMQQLTGINAIGTQIGGIVSLYDPYIGQFTPICLSTIQFIATFCSYFVIARFGRKPILLFGYLGLTLCNIALGVLFLVIQTWHHALWIVLVFLPAYLIIFGVSLGTTIWVYVPQIVPPKLVPFATFLNWAGCSICIVLFPYINQHLGIYISFFIFGGMSFIPFIINAFTIIETKGLSPEQIKGLIATKKESSHIEINQDLDKRDVYDTSINT